MVMIPKENNKFIKCVCGATAEWHVLKGMYVCSTCLTETPKEEGIKNQENSIEQNKKDEALKVKKINSQKGERKMKTGICVECGREMNIVGRGLCGKCYAIDRKKNKEVAKTEKVLNKEELNQMKDDLKKENKIKKEIRKKRKYNKKEKDISTSEYKKKKKNKFTDSLKKKIVKKVEVEIEEIVDNEKCKIRCQYFIACKFAGEIPPEICKWRKED